MTKRGLRTFLLLASLPLTPEIRVSQPPFIRLYRMNMAALRLAAQLGVRLPGELAARDKARVRLWLARWTAAELRRDFPEYEREIRRIRSWMR